MKLKGIVLFLAFAITASLGFSQSSGNGGTTSTSTSTNTVNATVVAAGGGQAQAIAGVSGTAGVFPGFPERNDEWVFYWNGLFQEVCPTEMESGRGKHDKVKTDVIDPNGGSDGDGCIHLLDWSPFNPKLFWPADREVSVTYALGKEDEEPEATLLAGLYDARQKTHFNRCAVWIRGVNEGITSGFSIGSGGSGNMTPGPGTNNETMAFATGGLIGKNTTRQANRPEFRIVCLNDGQLNPPSLKPPPAPAQNEAPTTPPAPAPPPPPVNEGNSAQPPTPPPPPVDDCLQDPLPNVSVYFAFDHPKVAEGDVFSPTVTTEGGPQDNTAAIHTIEQWLENHPTCKIDVVGYASHEASNKYNNDLGERRAKSVLNALNQDEKIRGQVFEADSNGKESAAPTGSEEHDWRDRRISFRIRGSDSSGR